MRNNIIQTEIENLKLPLNARTKMCTLHQMAKSVGKGNGELMPHLLVVGSGNEGETIGKLYAKMFEEYDLYPYRSEKNYLKLTYPVEGTDSLYDRFFVSPDIVASTTNRYYGIFVIDLDQWKSARGIMDNNTFVNLMDFVCENKRNISFVFTVGNEFYAKEELIYILKRKLNLEIFQDMMLKEEECLDYLVGEINQGGYKVTNGAKQLMADNIQENLNTGDINYDTLEILVQKILLRSKILDSIKYPVSPRIDKAFMNQVSEDVFDVIKNSETGMKIGFMK